MSDLRERIQTLPSEKRALLERLLRQRETSNESSPIQYVAPSTPTETILVYAWQEVLGNPKVGVHDNFLHLGGDSIHCIQIVAKVREAGIELTSDQVFAHPVIADLAKVVKPLAATSADQAPVTGPVCLTPIQRWFFDLELANEAHWNQAVLFTAPTATNRLRLQHALDALVLHHDALRLRFQRQSGRSWTQSVAPPERAALDFIDLSSVPSESLVAEIEKQCSSIQRKLNLEHGPLFRAALFDLGDGRGMRLLLCAHHLTVDGLSFRLLIEDLQKALDQSESGREIRLPLKTASFQSWAEQWTQKAESAAALKRVDQWIDEQLPEPIPLDIDIGANTEASARTTTVTLDASDTSALLRLPASRKLQILEVLLASFASAFGRWTGQQSVHIDLEGHGRDAILETANVSRTVGWFTSIYPVRLSTGSARDTGLLAMEIQTILKTQAEQAPYFGLLRYCGPEEIRIKLANQSQPQIMFNYLGQFAHLETATVFRLAPEAHGALYDPEGIRLHILQIFGGVIHGELRLHCTYSSNLHEAATIQNLMTDVAGNLRQLIDAAPSVALSVEDDIPAEDVRRILEMQSRL